MKLGKNQSLFTWLSIEGNFNVYDILFDVKKPIVRMVYMLRAGA